MPEATKVHDGATLTAETIRALLDREHSFFVTHGGQEYYVGEDEDCTGLYAWRTPVQEDERAVAGFGECDVDEPAFTPNYRAVSASIADWLFAEPPTMRPTDAR